MSATTVSASGRDTATPPHLAVCLAGGRVELLVVQYNYVNWTSLAFLFFRVNPISQITAGSLLVGTVGLFFFLPFSFHPRERGTYDPDVRRYEPWL